jgi:hypothetical protein
MNMLKITIPTGALLVSTLLAGTAIANNQTGAATVEELIINDTMAQENPLIAPKDVLSYQIASADGEENECEDEDEDEDEGEDEDGDENETGDDEDEDDDDDEYAACADQPVTSQG